MRWGGSLLHKAAVALGRNWQDEPHQQFRLPEPQDEWSLCGRSESEAEMPADAPPPAPVLARASWLTDPRPWDK